MKMKINFLLRNIHFHFLKEIEFREIWYKDDERRKKCDTICITQLARKRNRTFSQSIN